MSEQIVFNLTANALDYLLFASEQAEDNSPRMMKHAIATLADGVELLLKSRLQVSHPHLLFEKIDDYDIDKLVRGDLISVKFHHALHRLKRICGVSIDDKALLLLNALNSERNKIRHFEIKADRKQFESLITKAFSFAVDFTSQHLEKHLDGQSIELLRRVRSKLGELKTFVDARMKEIKAALSAQDYAAHVACPHCLQETLYAQDGEASCAFCGYRAAGEEAAAEWFQAQYGHVWDPKERMLLDDNVRSCPECGVTAAIPIDSGGKDGLQCLSCSQFSALQDCWRCGNHTYGELCDWCEHFHNKDD